jgi:uncharacterized damage-inducible protein DinB
MKLIFFTLLAVAISASPVCGQGSPSPAAAKPSAVEPTTLTKEERDRAVDYLKQTQKDFLAAIDGLSEEQWKFKAAPDRWSIAETAEHITVTEDTIWKLVSEKIMKSPAAPEKRAEAKGKDETILTVIPDRSRKAQAPERLKPTGKWATRAALVKDFDAMRGQEIAYLKETKEDLRSHFEEHPFLKTMDAYQWLIFNGAHAKRHTAQILEVKADPNFPKK